MCVCVDVCVWPLKYFSNAFIFSGSKMNNRTIFVGTTAHMQIKTKFTNDGVT